MDRAVLGQVLACLTAITIAYRPGQRVLPSHMRARMHAPMHTCECLGGHTASPDPRQHLKGLQWQLAVVAPEDVVVTAQPGWRPLAGVCACPVFVYVRAPMRVCVWALARMACGPLLLSCPRVLCTRLRTAVLRTAVHPGRLYCYWCCYHEHPWHQQPLPTRVHCSMGAHTHHTRALSAAACFVVQTAPPPFADTCQGKVARCRARLRAGPVHAHACVMQPPSSNQHCGAPGG